MKKNNKIAIFIDSEFKEKEIFKMKKIGKKLLATILTATLIVGTVGIVGAQTDGQDVSAGKAWTSYSIHGNNAEDKGEWEAALKKDGQVWEINANKDKVQKAGGKLDAFKTYGECAKIKSSSADKYVLDVTSTGWSANYTPTGTVAASNPWGVTTTKVVPVERGRYYTISFKIKSTLKNEITKCDDSTVITVGGKKVHYTQGTGKYNYVKHFHIKAYDNLDPDGAALSVQSMTAKYSGKNVMKSNSSFNNLIALDSRQDGYVDVNMSVLVPSDKADYQKKLSSPTMGIKMAFGPFLKEFKDENNMNGEVEVKEFKVTAKAKAVGAGKAKIKKIKAGKKRLTIKYKATGAKKYTIQVALKKNFKKGLKTKTTKKTSITIKGLKKKKKYYVRVKGAKNYKGVYIYGKWSKAKKSKKTK